jgi:integrase
MVGGVAGLGLRVGAGGSRSWILRHSVDGRRRDHGLGSFPEVTLAVARDAARHARATVRQGMSPIDAARASRQAEAARQAASKTFGEVAEARIQALMPSWRNAKHGEQWRSTLATYAYPTLASMPIGAIDRVHVQQVLAPLWTTKTETASRLRGRIENVLDYAIALGYRKGPNPAVWKAGLDAVLANPKKVAKPKHHAAMPWAQVPDFMRKLREADGQGARALEFAILCASRSGEIRLARWSEIDLRTATFDIPGERMKAGQPHRVPLSQLAVKLLKRQARMEGSDLIFPGPKGKALSDMTLVAVCRRMVIDVVPHGFRSSFRTWAGEATSFPTDVIEAALAHTQGNATVAAYMRGDLIEKRRQLMELWSRYCAGTDSKHGPIVPLGRGA